MAPSCRLLKHLRKYVKTHSKYIYYLPEMKHVPCPDPFSLESSKRIKTPVSFSGLGGGYIIATSDGDPDKTCM